MEIQFSKRPLDCMRTVVFEVQSEEQTQEIRLPDAMPDIGKILSVWGQPLIRSKDWRGNGMGITGGVMAWILYSPEDGTVPRVVETWIPFQMRWDFPQTQKDGIISISCLLKNIDARSVSARKMITRAVVEAVGEGMEPTQVELFAPEELPADMKMLRRQYPVWIVREAGEKTFLLDEELTVPATCADIQKLVYYNLQCEVIDKKVMGDKVVFRGAALLHVLCRCGEGNFKTFDIEIPFSQYGELSRLYEGDTTASVLPMLTNLELDIMEAGALRLKAGIAGQYKIYDRTEIETVEDAYSPNRKVKLEMQKLDFPSVLEEKQETIRIEQSLPDLPEQVVDVAFCVGHPIEHRDVNGVAFSIPGMFQVLCCGHESGLQSMNVRWESATKCAADIETRLNASLRPSGRAQVLSGAEKTTVCADLLLETAASSDAGITAVTGLEVSEQLPLDPDRPSIILRRVGSESLWELAKECGSTVEMIMEANGIGETVEEGKILLVPIL